MTAVAQHTSQPGTSVALSRDEERVLATIAQYSQQIADLAPKGLAPAYYTAQLMVHLRKNPDLLKCSEASLAQGILRVAATGLELGVTCDLLPFLGKNPTCQFNPRYNGLVDLSLKSGVRAVNADVVREDDVMFEFEKGTQFMLRHRRGPGKGKIIWAYAIAEIKQGSFVFEVMSRDEIDAIRMKFSKSWKKSVEWKNGQKIEKDLSLDDIHWYAIKTAIRKLSKMLPMNPRLAAALQFDADIREGPGVDDIDEGEYEIEPSGVASPADAAPVAAASTPTPPPAPAPAPAPVEAEEQEMTLAEAMLVTLVGPPESWGGKGGQALSTFSDKHLESIRKWSATKLEEKDDENLQRMVDAITLILIERGKDQTSMPLEATKPAITDTPFPEAMPEAERNAAVAANEARAKAAGF